MKLQKAALAAMMALALSAGIANAGSRIFGDSVLNIEDHFTDEITGRGPSLVMVAGAQDPQQLRATVKTLRKNRQVHLIHLLGPADDAGAAELAAYLARHHLPAADTH